MITILKLGPLGLAHSCSGSPEEGYMDGPGMWGVLGKVGVGDRVWNGVQKSLHSWKNPEGLFPWTAHVLPCPDSQVWAEEEGTCQMLPPRAQGGTAVLGKPQDPCQCL